MSELYALAYNSDKSIIRSVHHDKTDSKVKRWTYHHLHYFWVVAREGKVTKACDILHLSQPTNPYRIRDEPKQPQAQLPISLDDLG